MAAAARFMPPAPAPRQAGAGLLEVMVSLTLLAIALLGAATAVIHSQRAGQQSLLQTQATDLLAEIAERRMVPAQPALPGTASGEWSEWVHESLPLGRGWVEDSGPTDIGDVGVIEWREASGDSRRMQMTLPKTGQES